MTPRDQTMPPRDQLLRLLDEGQSYETAARRLGISAGLAFMIATGLPADGSDGSQFDPSVSRPPVPSSPQRLVNPPVVNPTRNEHVLEWVRARAARDLQTPA